ncbi:MAG: efflux RND transporter periplasmic adaptor subunit [Usitatibacter sp.]
MTLLVVAAALGLGLWYLGPRVASYEVRRADLVQSVVASGRVESPRRVEIGSALVGTVAGVPVDEGQSVAAGQVLVRLDDTEARAAVEAARTSVTQAEAHVAQIERTGLPVAAESVRQAEVTLLNTERQLLRTRELFDKGFVGQATLDDAQRARDVAQSQLDAARVQQASVSPRGADYLVAKAALEQARATLDAARAHFDLMTITAPTAGTLISRDVEVGSIAQPGKVLLVLSPSGATWLTVQIDEKNLNFLQLGEKALASADAYPAQRFAAEVVYINPGIDATRGSVEVKLRVPQPPSYLLQDMTVSVDIEISRRAGVLTVPADALHDASTTTPWVLVARDGRAARRAVKVGAHGSRGQVEVLQGLSEGERVIPSTEQSAQDGHRVRAT